MLAGTPLRARSASPTVRVVEDTLLLGLGSMPLLAGATVAVLVILAPSEVLATTWTWTMTVLVWPFARVGHVQVIVPPPLEVGDGHDVPATVPDPKPEGLEADRGGQHVGHLCT